MPSLALTMIVKNEVHNLPRLLQSAKGCFDHVYITDTGSTDGTLDYLYSPYSHNDAGCPVTVLKFPWVDDFAKARNHALPEIKEDYWMWMDADDTLANKDFFMSWKSSAMNISDVWFAPYVYAIDEKRNPIIQFVRERVFKTSKGYRFQDFVHEGVKLEEGSKVQAIDSWKVIHERTKEEMEADRGRNLRLLEAHRFELSPRLQFYFGKEHFDNGLYPQAEIELVKALQCPELGLGDRILAIQYLVQSLLQDGKYAEAIRYALIGVDLDPTRAEFYCFIGDAYCAVGKLKEAIPSYHAALGCADKGNGLTHEFTYGSCYDQHPKLNLAKIYFNMGNMAEAHAWASKVAKEPEAQKILGMIQGNMDISDISKAFDCDDIVITCPMQKAYDWDEDVYKTKGLGGSETAAVEMSRWLKKLTGRCVKIFQQRESTFVSESGVEYIPLEHMADYFKKWKPALHIAWRHNIKLTNAKTYIWCHDLAFDGLRNLANYEKVLALSVFHKEFLKATLGIPDEKILITRNGINPDRFAGLKFEKHFGRVIWPNSCDRGLEHAIMIMDEVRKEIPGAELHVFYGMDNMEKYGLADKAKMLKDMMSSRPWVIYHGNVNQAILAEEFSKAEVWLYSASFIESHCITALEAMLSKAYPVVGAVGALPYTLLPAIEANCADIIEIPPSEHKEWAKHVISAIEMKKWQEIDMRPDTFAWQGVASEWIKMFSL